MLLLFPIKLVKLKIVGLAQILEIDLFGTEGVSPKENERLPWPHRKLHCYDYEIRVRKKKHKSEKTNKALKQNNWSEAR
jgi:hypothetical protein